MHPNSVVGTKHMITTANPYATEAGLAVLEAGGTAMDAAVAAQFMLNLVEPESSGIGGGAFLLFAVLGWGTTKTSDLRRSRKSTSDGHG